MLGNRPGDILSRRALGEASAPPIADQIHYEPGAGVEHCHVVIDREAMFAAVAASVTNAHWAAIHLGSDGAMAKREVGMASQSRLKPDDYQRLAAFRLSLREFLATTDDNARNVGLTPQQHQALLSIKGGYPGRQTISISELADHLLIKNHSAVELVGRLVKADLVTREPSSEDRRTVCVKVTSKGEQLLAELSAASLDELANSAETMRRLIAGLEEPGCGAPSSS